MRHVYRRALAEYWRARAYGGSTRVLDVGCGFGANLPVYAEFQPGLLVGVDISREALCAIDARSRLALVQATADALPFRQGTFDAVGVLAVIEHVERDDRVLAESYRVVKPGGLQLLLTSAFMLLWSHHDSANRHLRRYNARALRRLQSAAGWRVVRMSYINAAIFPLVVAVRLAQRLTHPRGEAAYDMGPNPLLIRRLFEWLLKAEAWLTIRLGIALPFGVDLFCVSERHD